jgi:hypothetical protein
MELDRLYERVTPSRPGLSSVDLERARRSGRYLYHAFLFAATADGSPPLSSISFVGAWPLYIGMPYARDPPYLEIARCKASA